MSAIISACGLYRYRLDRDLSQLMPADGGSVIAYFGVNGSTADALTDDHTVRKWIGFSNREGARRFIVGNAFGYRAKDVKALARAADPVGPDNDRYLAEIIAEADILVPCWGSRYKIPRHLEYRLHALADMLLASGKPVKCFGVTSSGDPLHPLTLGWNTPLIDWWKRK
ncbi:DUF1643 domain-containing protein [Agrobacterium tumefaciens]